ncbi:hypothetical protein CYMTET_30903 [Cymbomonas tetramitiformis]|uniref:Uncharacterized protein n=1 Tax=Cymbomonas tetramitiformis TaxID=36881 RepID=A0AAE0FI30_9CHLO|nr:hypothetical protein CYMTET_30903 [Cymbomonas tetramitiformis]
MTPLNTRFFVCSLLLIGVSLRVHGFEADTARLVATKKYLEAHQEPDDIVSSFSETWEAIKTRLECGENFAFTRWTDDLLPWIRGRPTLSSGWTKLTNGKKIPNQFQKYQSDLHASVANVSDASGDGSKAGAYFLGLPFPRCSDESVDAQRDLKWLSLYFAEDLLARAQAQYFTYAWLFHDSNVENSRSLIQWLINSCRRKVVYIGFELEELPSVHTAIQLPDLHGKLGETNGQIAWYVTHREDINRQLEDKARTEQDTTFIVAAGALSNVFIHKLWRTNPTGNTYLNIGPVFQQARPFNRTARTFARTTFKYAACRESRWMVSPVKDGKREVVAEEVDTSEEWQDRHECVAGRCAYFQVPRAREAKLCQAGQGLGCAPAAEDAVVHEPIISRFTLPEGLWDHQKNQLDQAKRLKEGAEARERQAARAVALNRTHELLMAQYEEDDRQRNYTNALRAHEEEEEREEREEWARSKEVHKVKHGIANCIPHALSTEQVEQIGTNVACLTSKTVLVNETDDHTAELRFHKSVRDADNSWKDKSAGSKCLFLPIEEGKLSWNFKGLINDWLKDSLAWRNIWQVARTTTYFQQETLAKFLTQPAQMCLWQTLRTSLLS